MALNEHSGGNPDAGTEYVNSIIDYLCTSDATGHDEFKLARRTSWRLQDSRSDEFQTCITSPLFLACGKLVDCKYPL